MTSVAGSTSRTKTCSCTLATSNARALRWPLSLEVATNARRLRGEGAGNAGCFAHPQPRMQMKQAYELVTTGSPKRPGVPCAMVLRLTPRSLRRSGATFCHRRQRNAKHCRQLHASVEALRPRGFVVRDQRLRLLRHPRPSHPAPNVRDDRDTPLLWARDARDSAGDLGAASIARVATKLTRRANHLAAAKCCQGFFRHSGAHRSASPESITLDIRTAPWIPGPRKEWRPGMPMDL